MRQLYLILALLLATLVAIFAIQNADRVTVRFLVWTFQTSLVIVILISAGVGALLAALVSLPQSLKMRRQLRQSEGRLARLTEQHQLGGLHEREGPEEGVSEEEQGGVR
ncbi:MAG: lipopolysaccharide assembly LapA domain-containing protein [Candidatus Methylomirabilales bacterium]